MKQEFVLTTRPAPWRRLASALALAGAFSFPFQTSVSIAQVGESDGSTGVHTRVAKSANSSKSHASKRTAADNSADDLNRREAERAAQTATALTAPPAAQATPAASAPPQPVSTIDQAQQLEAPPVPLHPAARSANSSKTRASKRTAADNSADDLNRREAERAAQQTAALPPADQIQQLQTPSVPIAPADRPANLNKTRGSKRTAADNSADDLNRREAERAAQTTASLTAPVDQTQAPMPQQASQDQLAQAQPPVPIPPAGRSAAPRTPAPTTVVSGAPGRDFARSQLVQTQQPTLTLEVNKGSAIRLPAPAATVFVAAPDIADVQVKSPTVIFVFAKKPGDTVLYAVDDQDRVLLNTVVRVTSPLSRMKDTLEERYPGNGVTFDNQSDSIVLGGTVRSAAIAEDARRLALQHVGGTATKVVSQIRVDAPTQVQIRVKVAEVQRGALKRIGINWQNINRIAGFQLGGIGLPNLFAGAATSTFSTTGGPSAGGIGLATRDGSLSALIDLLATQNLATILAEPNLVAMSGETANFLAGSEIPIPTPQSSGLGNNTLSIVFKQVGVSLAFTPTIIGDRINLKVAPEVSQLTTEGAINLPLSATQVITVPAIQTRRASTTIELGSGQSFAIAGLLSQTSRQDIIKIPALGDIPVLGSLFKSDAYQRSETELVIIITPYFVEPSNGPLRTPLTDRVPATDADRLVLQRTTHPTPPRRLAVGQAPAGPSAGFKLD